jgi:predicted XRE-type DNA-binding protein
LRGLSPQEITYISDVVNDLLLEIPVKAEEIRNGVLHPSYGFTLIVKNTLEKDILENMGVPYNDQYTGACSVRTAGLLKLGENLGTIPVFTNKSYQMNSLGIQGKEELKQGYAPNSKITEEDLRKYQEILDEKDIVILHSLYVQKLRQIDVAKDVGVSQGAISHRVFMALTRIRLFEGIGGIPTDKELTNLCGYLCPADGTSEAWANHLLALKTEKGNQTNAAVHLGLGQPHMSQFMRKIYKRTRELLGPLDDYKGPHSRAYKYLDLLVKYPYSTRTLHVKRHQGKADYLKKKAKKLLSTK